MANEIRVLADWTPDCGGVLYHAQMKLKHEKDVTCVTFQGETTECYAAINELYKTLLDKDVSNEDFEILPIDFETHPGSFYVDLVL